MNSILSLLKVMQKIRKSNVNFSSDRPRLIHNNTSGKLYSYPKNIVLLPLTLILAFNYSSKNQLNTRNVSYICSTTTLIRQSYFVKPYTAVTLKNKIFSIRR